MYSMYVLKKCADKSGCNHSFKLKSKTYKLKQTKVQARQESWMLFSSQYTYGRHLFQLLSSNKSFLSKRKTYAKHEIAAINEASCLYKQGIRIIVTVHKEKSQLPQELSPLGA